MISLLVVLKSRVVNFSLPTDFPLVQPQSSIVHADPSISNTISINREEAQEHRAPIDTSIAITSFGDDVAKDIDAWPLTDGGKLYHDPYPDQNLTTVLSRVYRITTYSWSRNLPVGTFLFTHSFPSQLFREANIREKLRKFQFFRADVKVSVRVNGTAFCYGKLLVSWIPSGNVNNIVAFDLYRASQYPHVIVSANTNETQEFTIPYVSPYQFLNLGYYDENMNLYRDFFGSFSVYVLNPLRSSNSTETADLGVSFYASFVDPVVAGPTSTIYDLARAEMSNPTSQEAQALTNKDSQVGAVGRSLGAFISKIPIVGSVFKYTGIGLRFLGFDKTTSQTLRQYNDLNLGRGFCMGDGMDYTNKLALKCDNQVSNDWAVYRQAHDEMNFEILLALPTLIQVTSITSDVPTGTIFYTFPVSPMYHPYGLTPPLSPTRLAFFSGYFEYWRGAINYAIQISAGAFTSCRIRVSWHPNFDRIPISLSDGEGDYISHVIDITGDTLYKFSIPYLQAALWQRTGRLLVEPSLSHTNGVIMLSIVNPVRTTDNVASNAVYINLWQAAGPGFELAKPTTPNWVVAQYSMRDEFLKNDFEPLIPAMESCPNNITMGESVSSLRTLLHRYSARPPSIASARRSLFTVGSVTTDLCKPFHFARGSYRLRNISTTSAPLFFSVSNVDVDNPTPSAFNGLNYTVTTYKPALETEIPFYSRYICPLIINNFGQVEPFPTYQVNSVGSEFISVGDDFTVGWAIAVPNVTYLSFSTDELITTPRSLTESVITEALQIAIEHQRKRI